jgi:hypothetical protein
MIPAICGARRAAALAANCDPLKLSCTSCSSPAGTSCEGGATADNNNGCAACLAGKRPCVRHAVLHVADPYDLPGYPMPPAVAKTRPAPRLWRRPRRRRVS